LHVCVCNNIDVTHIYIINTDTAFKKYFCVCVWEREREQAVLVNSARWSNYEWWTVIEWYWQVNQNTQRKLCSSTYFVHYKSYVDWL